MLFGGRSPPHVLDQYLTQFHGDGNHQAKANILLFPLAEDMQSHGAVLACSIPDSFASCLPGEPPETAPLSHATSLKTKNVWIF